MFTDIDFELKYDNDEIPEYVVFNKKQRKKINGVWKDIGPENIKISRAIFISKLRYTSKTLINPLTFLLSLYFLYF